MYDDPVSIDRIHAWLVSLPMERLFQSARSRFDRRHVVIVRVDSGDASGWGEAAPVPGHTAEDIDTVWHSLPSREPASGLARAAIEQAQADISAKRHGQPLWAHLGGTEAVTASVAISSDQSGQPSPDQIEAAASLGYRAMKLKVTPDTDVQVVAHLTRMYPTVQFGADANGSFDSADSHLLAGLDELGLAYIEQPGAFHDLEWHRSLRATMQTPLALDESAANPTDVDRILAADAADIITLKCGRFGTMSTLRLARKITDSGLAVRLGGLLESGVGRAHGVALASHPVFGVTGDVAGSDQYFADDLVRPQWRMVDGLIPLPPAPGIGVSVDTAAIERYAESFVSSGD